MQRLGVSSIQRLITSSKNEEGSETMKVAGNPGNLASKLQRLHKICIQIKKFTILYMAKILYTMSGGMTKAPATKAPGIYLLFSFFF